MRSGPADLVYPSGEIRSRLRHVGLRLIRYGILLIVVWCVWLTYPTIKIRLCLNRVESYYTPVLNAETGEIDRIEPRGGHQLDAGRMAWEEDLANQPLWRLLQLLSSNDPIRVWVVSRAIETQLRLGRMAGWPGKREPVSVDVETLSVVLDALDRGLPKPADEYLLKILQIAEQHVRAAPEPYRATLIAATARRDSRARWFGTLVLSYMNLDLEESLELVRTLSQDSDSSVRERLFGVLVPACRGREFSNEYHKILLAGMSDDSPAVRVTAVHALDFLDLKSPEIIEVAQQALEDSNHQVRHYVLATLLNALQSGRLDVLPDQYVDPLCEAIAAIDGPYETDVYFFRVLTIPTISIDRRWKVIEKRLMSPELPYVSADLREALFMPNEPAGYRTRSAGDWKAIRERFRPFAIQSKSRLIEWASRAIYSADEETVSSAVGLLTAVAPHEPDRLTPALRHRSPRVLAYAFMSLVPSEEQLPLLLDRLDDPDPGICRYAASAVGRYNGKLTSQQIEQLHSAFRQNTKRDMMFYASLFRLLEKHLARQQLDQMLIDALRSDFSAGDWAVQEIRQRQLDIDMWLPYLMEGIRAKRLGFPAVALVIETGRSIESPSVIAQMIERLLPLELARSKGTPVQPRDRGDDVQVSYLNRLMELCPPECVTSELIDAVITMLCSPHEATRQVVLKLLNNLAVSPDAIVARVMTLMEDDRRDIRHNAAIVLATFGPSAKPASGQLIVALNDSDIQVRIAAATALGAVGPDAGPDAAAALARMANHEKLPGAQLAAIEGLAHMGPLMRPWCNIVEDLSKKGDRMVREAADKALNELKQSK